MEGARERKAAVSEGEQSHHQEEEAGARGRHHGGAWKVAYADFVTAMMALFIVLWIVANNVTVRASVADYFRDPGAMHKTSAGVLSGVQTMRPFSESPPLQANSSPNRAELPDEPEPAAPSASEVEKLREEGEKLLQDDRRYPGPGQIQGPDPDHDHQGRPADRADRAVRGALLRHRQRPAQAGCRPAAQADRLPHRHLPERPHDRRPHRQPALHARRVQQLGPQHRPCQLRAPGARGERHPRTQIAAVNGYADRRLEERRPNRLDFSNRRVTIWWPLRPRPPPSPDPWLRPLRRSHRVRSGSTGADFATPQFSPRLTAACSSE